MKFKILLNQIKEITMREAKEIDLENEKVNFRILEDVTLDFGDTNFNSSYYNVWYGHHYLIRKYLLIREDGKIEFLPDGARISEKMTNKHIFIVKIILENYDVEGQSEDKYILVDFYPLK